MEDPKVNQRVSRKKRVVDDLDKKTIPYDYPLPEDSWPGGENGPPEKNHPRSNTPVGRKAREARAAETRPNPPSSREGIDFSKINTRTKQFAEKRSATDLALKKASKKRLMESRKR